MVSIFHHGAVTGVTGSSHQRVLDADTSVLIDCGLLQKRCVVRCSLHLARKQRAGATRFIRQCRIVVL